LKTPRHFLGRELITPQVLLQQGVIPFGRRLDHTDPRLLGLRLDFRRDRGGLLAVTQACLHGKKVDHALEVGMLPDRKLHRHKGHLGRQSPDGFQGAGEAGVFAVHLADDDEARQPKSVAVVPNDLRPDLDASDGVDQHQRPFHHAQGRDRFADEIGVARRIEQVDLHVPVLERHDSGGKREAAAASSRSLKSCFLLDFACVGVMLR
jgi:hypothetical protein